MYLKVAYFLIFFFPLMRNATGYNYCGNKSVSIYRHPINKLDEACRKQKLVYIIYVNNVNQQMEADKWLIAQARDRMTAPDCKIKEKAAAWLMVKAVKQKREPPFLTINATDDFPSYNYCGFDLKTINPLPINQLDEACWKQKMVYGNSNSSEEQMDADRRLIKQAWERVAASDSDNSEGLAAWLVVNTINIKNGWSNEQSLGIFKGKVHIPSYEFCGPGTNITHLTTLTLEELNKFGVNKLDQYCLKHDLIYDQNPNAKKIIEADRNLAGKAFSRITEPDSSFGEKASAFVVTICMVFKQPYNYMRSWFS